MTEALAQKDNITGSFPRRASFSKATHPNTVYLVQGGLRVAQFVAMHYKNRYQWPRPSQLWPELMPPIRVPGHASFPSGHATEAYMVAAILNEVAAGVAPSVGNITLRLAQRIARNREVLGLHYPSDSLAGFAAAARASTIFTTGHSLRAGHCCDGGMERVHSHSTVPASTRPSWRTQEIATERNRQSKAVRTFHTCLRVARSLPRQR